MPFGDGRGPIWLNPSRFDRRWKMVGLFGWKWGWRRRWGMGFRWRWRRGWGWGWRRFF